MKRNGRAGGCSRIHFSTLNCFHAFVTVHGVLKSGVCVSECPRADEIKDSNTT